MNEFRDDLHHLQIEGGDCNQTKDITLSYCKIIIKIVQ